MIRYLLFRSEATANAGGARDFVACFDGVEEAQASDADPKEWVIPRSLEEHYRKTWAHVAAFEPNGELTVVAAREPGQPWRVGS